jgi:hypothetical protein
MRIIEYKEAFNKSIKDKLLLLVFFPPLQFSIPFYADKTDG